MGLTLLAGPQLHASTMRPASRAVAIVNQQFAQHYWPGQDPIGKRLQTVGDDKAWVQVVGLAKTSKYIFIAEAPTEFVYLPHRQKKQQEMILLAQSAGDPASARRAAARRRPWPRREHADLQRPHDGAVLPDARRQHLQRARRARSAAMGLMGLGLSIVGLYGLVVLCGRTAHARDRHPHGDRRRPRRRARDGAAPGDRAGGGRSRCWGSSPASAPESCCGRHFRPATTSGTPAPLLIVVPIVLAVTFLAAYVPARSASRLNPVQALRHD